MEAVPEQRPSEWDKRLSTHSPFRTVGINGQPLAGPDGVSLPCTGFKHLHSGLQVGSVQEPKMKQLVTSLAPYDSVEIAHSPIDTGPVRQNSEGRIPSHDGKPRN